MRIWCKGIEIKGLGEDSTFKRFKTWAPNSGRSSAGKSTGRVAYWKYKAFVKCPFVPKDDYKTFKSIFETEPQYFAVRVIDDNGEEHNLTMYSGDLQYSSVVNCGNGEIWYRGVEIELVEE